MNNEEKITEIKKRLSQGRYYVPYAPDDIKYLLEQLAESQRREKAAVEDMRGICYLCKHSEPYKIGNVTLKICKTIKEVVARTSRPECEYFEWRGVKGGGE